MSNSIRSITEDKLTAYLSANLTGVAVHKGVTADIRVVPIVVIHAASAAKPTALGANNLGNYRVNVKVYVYSSADDDTLQTHRDRVEKVIGLLTDQAAVQTAWGTGEGQCYAIWLESDDEGMAQRRYGNVINFTLFAVVQPQP